MEKRILKRMGKMMYGEKKKKKINTREKKKKKDLEIGSLLFKGLFCFKKIERKKKRPLSCLITSKVIALNKFYL